MKFKYEHRDEAQDNTDEKPTLSSTSVPPSHRRTFTTASSTSALAILAAPKDLTLKEQILRLRDGLKQRSENKTKNNILET